MDLDLDVLEMLQEIIGKEMTKKAKERKKPSIMEITKIEPIGEDELEDEILSEIIGDELEDDSIEAMLFDDDEEEDGRPRDYKSGKRRGSVY